MSLEQLLYNKIKEKGKVNLIELWQVAEQCGHKQSTAERKLRKLTEKEKIKPIKNDKGYINHYQLKNNLTQSKLFNFKQKKNILEYWN